MATVINNPPSTTTGDGTGPITMIVGIVFLVLIAWLVFAYAVPALNRMQGGAPQITVPDKVDVTIKQQSGE